VRGHVDPRAKSLVVYPDDLHSDVKEVLPVIWMNRWALGVLTGFCDGGFEIAAEGCQQRHF
jgi:hypothetical protein